MNCGFIDKKCKDCKLKDTCYMAKLPNTSGCTKPIISTNQGLHRNRKPNYKKVKHAD